MEVEFELTRDDLYAFQWRGVFETPRGRRARRNVYLGWLLAIVLFAIVPAIGADGFVISRVTSPSSSLPSRSSSCSSGAWSGG